VLVAIFVAAVAIYAAVVAQDLRQRQVSNLFCAGIAALGFVRWIVLILTARAEWLQATEALAVALLLFSVGIFFFSRGWMGGGDIKLIVATALLLGAADVPAFLFLMSLIGSALALPIVIYLGTRRVMLHLRKRRAADGTAPTEDTSTDARTDPLYIPYGVAIALAATIVFFQQIQRA
jgi:prepilin peptidase CpaA